MVLTIGRPHVSTFDQLPVELITKILLLYVLHEDKISNPLYFEPYQRRHTLSKVCHAWEDAIEQCPFFWTDINVNDLENVPHALEHSGPYVPLNINGGAADDCRDCADRERFLDLVLPHSHRWQSFELETGRPDDAVKALRGVRPRLETLYLSFSHDYKDLCLPDETHLPAIKDLQLVSVILPKAFVDLANLTNLQLHKIRSPVLTSATMLDILRESPGLRTLQLYHVQCQDIEDANLLTQGDSAVGLPDLEHLELQNVPQSFIYQVLGNINAENLKLLCATTYFEQLEYSQLGRNILHDLIANRVRRASMVSNVIRNHKTMEAPMDGRGSDLTIASSLWPISISGNGRTTVTIGVLHPSWMQEPLHPRDLLVFQGLAVTFEVWNAAGLSTTLRDGFPVFEYLPTLVTLGLLSGPEETIRIIDHITGMAGSWPCPWLTMIGVGDITDYGANEIARLQPCVARFVAAFRHSPNRLIPRVTLLSRQEVVQ